MMILELFRKGDGATSPQNPPQKMCQRHVPWKHILNWWDVPWQSHGSCTGYKCNTFNSLHRFETASFLFIYQEGSDLPDVQGHDHAIIQWKKQTNHHWNTNLRSWYVIDLQSSMQTDSREDVCVVVFDLFRSVREHLWDWIKFVSNISCPVGRTTSAWTKWDLMSPLLITV